MVASTKAVRAGLYVQVGDGRGALSVALSDKGRNTVVGFCAHDNAVSRARSTISSAGLYGTVSVDKADYRHLPLVDNAANLVIAHDIEAVLDDGGTVAELSRVAAPRGVLLVGDVRDTDAMCQVLAGAGLNDVAVVEGHPTWVQGVKPLPDDVDDWQQFRHDPSRGALSMDMQVAPVTGLHWIQGPEYGGDGRRINTILSSEGRNFYFGAIRRRGRRDAKQAPSRTNCRVSVRDAFNGSLLWEKDIYLVKGTQLAAVAVDGRVYTHVAAGEPFVALDAATGEVVQTYTLSGGLTWYEGNLVVNDEPGQWTVVDPADGTVLRTFSVKDVPAINPGEVVIEGDRLYVLEDGPLKSKIVCFDYNTGTRLWDTRNRSDGALFSCARGILLTKALGKDRWTDPGVLAAYDAATGKHLWDYDLIEKWGKKTSGVFLGDKLWTFDADFEDRGGRYVGLDAQSCSVVPDNGPHKSSARCSEDRITPNYILGTDMDLVDKDMNVHRCHFARSTCGAGYIPANGMLYQHRHGCICGTFIGGVLGLTPAPLPPAQELRASSPEPLETGPAAGTALAEESAADDQWPMYRHDAYRSGVVAAALADKPSVRWSTELGGALTSPVAADGRVVVASADRHTVASLDAAGGKVQWQFVAGGRVDTPPTLYRGLALFGARDGYVYCLRVSDGALVWRYRAAPMDIRIPVNGQVESKWPVYGTVLIDSGTAYVSAGRHSDADGGLSLHAFEPATGRVLWQRDVAGMPPLRTDPMGANLDEVRDYHQEVGSGLRNDMATLNDIPISDGTMLYVGGLGIDKVSQMVVAAPRGTALYGGAGTMLYDNTTSPRVERSHWKLTGASQNAPVRLPGSRATIRATTMSVDSQLVYGLWPGKDRLELFAADYRSGADSESTQWVTWFEKGTRANSLAVTRDKVLVACSHTVEDDSSSVDSPWELRMFSRADGHELSRTVVQAGTATRFDGLAVAGNAVFASTGEGVLVCLQ